MCYKFVDLFAGIGGFRLGFEKVGFQCVFSSEIDNHAREMYQLNFGDLPFGDIKKIELESIPHFDILLAGFPCQPFSIAGEKKGFNDIRGTLFFDIAKILEYHRPKVIVLENVKHFKSHDKGRTLKIVLTTLNDLGYTINWALLNGKDFGVPQNRERTIIIGYLGQKEFNFDYLKQQKCNKLADILEKDSPDFEYLKEEEYTLIENPKKQLSGLIFAGYRNKNIRLKGTKPNTKHLSRVHKQPNRIYSSEGNHPTLSSQESAGRYYILHNGRVRKLTLRECYRLMGFPDDFKLIGSKAKLYNRIGNSVVVPMIEAIAQQVKGQFFETNYLNKNQFKPKQISLFDSELIYH
ncbi:DNA (cytosine-5-)-methyltransferase [Cyanobacterium sp. Dongsha4]|uniref:DNA cytosine methyltransferase n=1 Tax=Cyanobacterium sp. DS4 TaxID=2878255 RepID=UPI002E800B68|nr:DNA (cytosine-5-)-methyltransferase [Cyanobacterium sp. Dongsha4]WVL01619.1 DNA (cytosine-5-)-methyltransferase [Cyanobacterium sp. Dongsha4]